MAGFLSKFARGAAGAGGKLMMDSYMEEQRAEIMSKRDAQLQKNRMEVQRDDQAFRASESALAREEAKNSPRAQIAEMDLAARKQMDGLKAEWANASGDERKAIEEKAKNILGHNFDKLTSNQKMSAKQSWIEYLVSIGSYKTRKEAVAAMDKSGTSSLAPQIFAFFAAQNEDLSTMPEDKMSIQEILAEVEKYTNPQPKEEPVTTEKAQAPYRQQILLVHQLNHR